MRGILPVASIPDPPESAADILKAEANPCGDCPDFRVSENGTVPFNDVKDELETLVDRPRIERAVREILLAVGEDPDREGLHDTPKRVARMYAELFGGLHQDPRRHLRKFFTETCDEVVLVRDISFNSVCEHHLLPFMGTAHVAYLPDQRVIGLSKLARVVEEVARRPQVQERMTEQIANLLVEELHAKGVAVVIEAVHTCMTIRGIRKPGSVCVTSAMKGCFRTKPSTRAELMTLIYGNRR
jgi:GTP cyclohydrolase I